jgi:4-amino-4-deoxy-L-arabinose transferase-like glycosyltransferase
MLAAALRLAVLILAEGRPDRFDFPDSHRYVRIARNIVAGLGPIESKQVQAGTDPLYPYLLSIGVRLGFADPLEAMRFGRAVNSLFSLASVLLLALFSRRLFGNRPALFAAAILAVDPILLFFTGLVLTETPYITLLLAGFYCLTLGSHLRRGLIAAAAAGALLGLATCMRSSSLFMPLAVVPLLWHFSGGPPRRRLAAIGLLIAGAAIMLVPTVSRNYRLFRRFVPVCTHGGAGLLEALGPWADGGPGMDRIKYPTFPPGIDECERDRLCRVAAWGWAREHPADTLHLAWVKLRRTWSVTINAAEYASSLYALVAWTTVAPEFLLAAFGALGLLLQRRFWPLILLLLPAVYFTLVHMVFVGSVRYRLPAMPFLFVLAGLAVDLILQRRRRKDQG